MSKWNIFSNHGHVLLFLARHPDARLRDVAANVGITERAVQKIVRDMQDTGVVEVTRIGRRNRYAIHGDAPLQHSLEAHRQIGEVGELIAGRDAPALAGRPPTRPARAAWAPAPQPAVPKPKPGPEPKPKPAPKPAPEPGPEPGPQSAPATETAPGKAPGDAAGKARPTREPAQERVAASMEPADDPSAAGEQRSLF